MTRSAALKVATSGGVLEMAPKKKKWLEPLREVVGTCHPRDIGMKDSAGKPLPATIVWRNAVLGPDGPHLPAIRFALLALAHHMNEDGYCFPSIDLIALETGYAESTVKRNLKFACDEGWIKRTSGMGYKQRWRCYEYEASIPTFKSKGGLTVRPRFTWSEMRRGIRRARHRHGTTL